MTRLWTKGKVLWLGGGVPHGIVFDFVFVVLFLGGGGVTDGRT